MSTQVKIKPGRVLYGELHADVDFVMGLERVADDVASTARSLAPVETGDYRASIDVDVATFGEQQFVRVWATDFKAAWIEFGTGGDAPTYAYSPLRRAARKHKLKFSGSAASRRLLYIDRARKRGIRQARAEFKARQVSP
jgi:hypothetical protein